MKLAVLQENFALALTSVLRAIETKPVLTILSHVKLTAAEDTLTVTAANLEWSMDVVIGARVYDEGSFTLPSKFLSQLVSKLPHARIDLALNAEAAVMTFTCGESVSEIKGVAATEYLPARHSDGPQRISLKGETLKTMIDQVVPVAATDDMRPVLTGVYVRIDRDVLTLAAANGYQSAERTTRLDLCYPERQEVVVSAALLREASRMIAKVDWGDEVILMLPKVTGRVVTLVIGRNVVLRGNTLEGTYPDYAEVFPQRFASFVTVPVREMTAAVDMALIAARENANSGHLVVKDDTLTITGVSAEYGRVSQTLESRLLGELTEVRLDLALLKVALKTMPGVRVIIQLNGLNVPIVLCPEILPDLRHLIMPMTK